MFHPIHFQPHAKLLDFRNVAAHHAVSMGDEARCGGLPEVRAEGDFYPLGRIDFEGNRARVPLVLCIEACCLCGQVRRGVRVSMTENVVRI